MKKLFFLTLILLNSSCNSVKFLNDYSSLKSYPKSLKLLQLILIYNNWHNLDPETDTIPGTSVERAHKELLKGFRW